MTTSSIIIMNIVGPSLHFYYFIFLYIFLLYLKKKNHYLTLIMTIVFLALCMGTHTRLHAYHYTMFGLCG